MPLDKHCCHHRSDQRILERRFVLVSETSQTVEKEEPATAVYGEYEVRPSRVSFRSSWIQHQMKGYTKRLLELSDNTHGSQWFGKAHETLM